MKTARSPLSHRTAKGPALRSVPATDPPPRAGLLAAKLVRVGGGTATVLAGGSEHEASHEGVHPIVLEGALARGERVLLERTDDGELVILGALRTQPTPGVDAAQGYTIEADRIELRARSELSLAAQTAGLVLRAAGEVETYAERILSRAEGLHKIVGRMLRLN